MGEEAEGHQCVLCNTSLSCKEALQEHFRKHANGEIDSRGHASKKIGHFSQMKRAQCSASVSSPHQSSVTCDVCGLIFSTATRAINHKWRVHPNQPSKFCCSYCGKHFTMKTIHDKHIRDEHSGSETKTILQCEECNEQFFNETARNYHSRIAHRRVKAVLKPLAAPPPSKKIRISNAGYAESVYYCHLCGTEYISKFNLRKHLASRHSEEAREVNPEMEVFRCTICEAIFFNTRAYEAHTLYHQPDDLYVVSEEHRLKTLSRVDLDFDVRRVHVQQPKTVQGYARLKMKMVQWDSTPLSSSGGDK